MSQLTEEISRRRTFAIISHPDAGKTTLTEKFLLYGGAIAQAGEVKGKRARAATSDWMEIEKQRGISVTSSVMQFQHGGYCINILDTPGHQDFSEDTYRTLMAADSAVMVIDGAKGVEPQTRKLFRVCAPLHDVGKVGIPDSILRKPGKLTEAEFNEMKKHTTLGYQTLSWAEKRMGGHNDFLRLGAVIAYTHHERWDGKGYPRGLKGEEIPRVGRLMALADVYDALISKRVYKPAFDHETARNIIVEGRGTQFDPLVVEAFLFEEDAFRSLIVTYPDDENPLLVSND